MKQSERLTMVGVATAGQSDLARGIHLRWAFRPEMGFPPHGFMLFRKPSKSSEEICLKKVLAGRPPVSNAGYRTGSRDLEFESHYPLRLVDRFPAAGDGQVEIDLEARRWVRARFGGPMKRVRIQLFAQADARFRARALWRGVVVDERVERIARGKTAKLELRFDSIDVVEIDGAPALLVDLCGEPLFPEAASGWRQVPGFAYPLGLPLTHPDYPATGNAPEDVARYRTTARGRIVVPNAPPFPDEQLEEAYKDLLRLVIPGPPAQHERFVDELGQPADGVDADLDDNSPRLRLYTLQKVLLAALRPAGAQMVGLYWLDAEVKEGELWDYLILGLWTSPAKLFGADWKQRISDGNVDFEGGIAGAHGYVVTELSLAAPAKLDPPRDVRSYVLPGLISRRSDGGIRDWRNNVGLRWAVAPADGILRSRAPVFFDVHRAGLGNGTEPRDPRAADYGKPITGAAPIMVTEAPANLSPTRPPAWPPFPLHYIDRGVAEGWYAYRLRSIDLFGRRSPLGEPADWYGWDPPALERADAVLARDRMPPPPPPGVEARALQPQDRYLDRADVDWLEANLTAAERAADAAALRVDWRWPDDFKEAAPDLDPNGAFRVYFQSDLLNAEGGRIDAVDDQGAASQVVFSTSVAHGENALAGVRLRSRNELFQVTANTANAAQEPAVLTVDNLSPSSPELEKAPRPGGASVIFPAGHARHVDYSDPASWSSQIHQEPYDPAKSAYRVYFPVPAAAARWFLPLPTSEDDPIRYGSIGVTAVDANGNESRVAGPAQVVVLRRTPPAAPPLPPDSERVWATRPDYHGRSAYTFRWHGSQSLRYVVCRALEGSLFRHDFRSAQGEFTYHERRNRLGADPFAHAELAGVWPQGFDDVVPPAVVSRRVVVSGELNSLWDALDPIRLELEALPADAPATARTSRVEAAMELYAGLGNDALRVLASLPDNSVPFSRLVPEPLGHWTADGDGNGTYEYTDRTEGRGRSRYFYRARSVDAANNVGSLSLSSPPVYLPDERPPAAPRLARVAGGDRGATLSWSAHPAGLVDRYRIFRSTRRDEAADVRLMGAPVAEVPAEPLDRTPLQWNDAGLVGGETYFYRVVALRLGDGPNGPVEIVSTPSAIGAARVFERTAPNPPEWEQVLYDGATQALTLRWRSDYPQRCIALRVAPSGSAEVPLTGWIEGTFDGAAAVWVYGLTVRTPASPGERFRIRGRTPGGHLTASEPRALI